MTAQDGHDGSAPKLGALLDEGKTKRIHAVAATRPGGPGASRTTSPPATAPSTTSCPARPPLPTAPPQRLPPAEGCGSAGRFRRRPARRASCAPHARCCPTRWWCGARRTAPTSSGTRICPRASFPAPAGRVLPEDQGPALEGSTRWSPTIRSCAIAPTAAIELFDPAKPLPGQTPFLTLAVRRGFRPGERGASGPMMAALARQAFLILEQAWQLQGGRLVDFKVEFGLGRTGTLLLADVIDNDFLAGAAGRRLCRQAGLSRGRRPRRGDRELPAGRRDHRRLPRCRARACRLDRIGEGRHTADREAAIKASPGVPTVTQDRLLGPQGAGPCRDPAGHGGPGGAGQRGHRAHRALQRRRPDAVGQHHRPGHHDPGRARRSSRTTSGPRCACRAPCRC